MRLLQLRDGDDFSLVEYVGNNTPPYAILSHTWEAENDEVNFKDIVEGKRKTKSGYRKLDFCGKQAALDGLAFFWVDTCCIDKSSSAELAEAINSMFRWYHNAAKCYVYLTDVSTSGLPKNSVTLRNSRWFTRGWTLQELLAPESVEFFSAEGDRLGDKLSLMQEVAGITKIPSEALQGKSLSYFSVEERMKWAEGRKTTREEDMAYSLLGIFDIHMPLIYGEGEEKALKRLQKEISDSPEAKPNKLARDARLREIYHWLSAPDPLVNYQRAIKQRQPDTGLWFLENERYESWKMDAGSTLWLHGIPGCGKTILSSTILQDVMRHCENDPGKVVVYFFFDFNDVQKQKANLMLHSLICQLSQQSGEILESLDTLCSLHENGKQRPSQDDLLEVLHKMMHNLPRVYIILDALDECAQRMELLEVVEAIIRSQFKNLHLIVTSRGEKGIESSLEEFVDPKNRICLQSDVVDKDIQQYVQQRLSKDKDLNKWGKDIILRQEIETALTKGSKGMFRWAVCQLDSLGKCRNRAMLRKSLATLPPTLDKTYERILSAIKEEDCEYAIRILRWLAFSHRPLTLGEVAEVVAIDGARDPAFNQEEVLEDPLDALDICLSLVTLESNAGTLVLAHYSVKEYLVSERIDKGQAARYRMQEAMCHRIIAEACFGYLEQFQQFELMANDNLEEFKGFRLAYYAAKYWVSHVRNTKDQIAETSKAAIRLLETGSAVYSNLIRIYDPDNPWAIFIPRTDGVHQTKKKNTLTPLYYAALLGLEEVVKLLLEKHANVNAQGGKYGTALQAASLKGYEQVVKLLLENGADVNAQGGPYGSALQAASWSGNEKIVELLLNNNADVNAQGGDYGNALQAASWRGHENVVKLLLMRNADSNMQVGVYDALQGASRHGHDRVVKLLLENNADVNAPSGDLGNALQEASWAGHERVVRLLLDSNADVNAQGGHWGSALHAASWRNHERVVRLLLERNADVNVQDGKFGGALEVASWRDYERLVKLLLMTNVDINTRGGRYGNALQTASFSGCMQTVELLLKAGFCPNSWHPHYGSCLHLLASHGNTNLLRVAYDQYQGNLFLCDPEGRTTLQLAARSGSFGAFQYLLSLGLDSSAKDTIGNGLLHFASSGGSLDILNAVIDSGYTAYGQNNNWSPLHWACRKGNSNVVKKLMEIEIPSYCVNVGHPEGAWNPASIAIFHRKEKMLKELPASIRSRLDAPVVPARPIGEPIDINCDSCFHEIYGPRFNCRTCSHLNYCFMCKPFIGYLHENHEWECIEPRY